MLELDSKLFSQERLSDKIISILRKNPLGCYLTYQIEQILGNINLENEKSLVKTTLLSMLEEGEIEALIFDNVIKKWQKVEIQFQNNENNTIFLPMGEYFVWRFERVFPNFVQKMFENTENNFFLDTSTIRKKHSKAILRITLILEDLMSNSNYIELKLLWILPEYRNELPI